MTEPAPLDRILAAARVIPVIALDRLDAAVPLARALVAAGVRVLEISLQAPAGLAAVRAIARDVPAAIVGAGAVLAADDLARAADAGACFALSSGATPSLLAAAARASIPFLPGVCAAPDLTLALAHGFQTVKFFPATAAGGVPALKALAGPFPGARFCPAGGITRNAAAAWLLQPNVVAVAGSWLAPPDDIAAARWDAIQERARQTRILLAATT